MFTLMFLFALQVASPGEMACTGSIQEMVIPDAVYIAGVEGEGKNVYAVPGRILFLNGHGVSQLKAGSVQKVMRPEGKVRPTARNKQLGFYYKDIGTVRIESVDQKQATARVLTACEGMLKGDVVIANASKPVVEFSGNLSDDSTPSPRGFSSTILFAKNDVRQIAEGSFCFIEAGKLDGVKPGDRFTVVRRLPGFNGRDMDVSGTKAGSSYAPMRDGIYNYRLRLTLKDRTVPPVILGDIVIVDVSERVSTGKVVSSRSEIYPGDRVVRR